VARKYFDVFSPLLFILTTMTQKVIDKIQDKVTSFLREDKKNPKKSLSDLCVDSCSELSRLVAFWLSQELPKAKFCILKGNKIKKGEDHDVLAVSSVGGIYLLDTTIWQFFPDSESIYIGEFTNLSEAVTFLEKLYGGKWQVSEELDEESFREKDEWERIIRLNLRG